MSVDKKTLVGTIDLTPTWAEQAVRCIAIIQNYDYPEKTREDAAKELIRMGKIIDQHIHNAGAVFAKRDVVALERDEYFNESDNTERWFDVTVIGSQYEQQTSTRRNWRHRPIYNHSIRGDWIAGRAPDVA